MYASASTWMLNAVREIQIASGVGDVAVHFVREKINVELLDRKNTVNIVKSHEVTRETVLLALAGRADAILMTVRDPRDAIASLMEYQKTEFTKAMNLVKQSGSLCAEFLTDRRTTCFAYETHFFDRSETLLRLARILGCAISDDAATACFDRLTRPAVEKLIEQLPNRKGVLYDRLSGDFLDPQTQWHTHHAGRSGEIGRWRRKLSQAEAQQVLALSETHRMSRFTL
jgi:hypothetical protein